MQTGAWKNQDNFKLKDANNLNPNNVEEWLNTKSDP